MFKKSTDNMAAQDVRDSTNQIGKGTILEGNIESFGNIRIEGKVIGNIKSKSKIALGQSSYVDGNIISQNAEIEGEVKGKVQISDLLILKKTAVVGGDIIANKLLVESGATFNGSCKMGVSQKEIKIGENGQLKEQPGTGEKKPGEQQIKAI